MRGWRLHGIVRPAKSQQSQGVVEGVLDEIVILSELAFRADSLEGWEAMKQASCT
jgi:hypothetical protein